MPSRIAQLKLTSFRGASQPLTVTFDQNKTVVMIFGENGTGKSTLIDAIDAVSNESLGSIVERGAGGNSHQYLRSLAAATQLEVELSTKAGHSWRATLSGRNVRVQAVGGHTTARSPVRVLRRSKLLQLLEDRPADRYAAMKHFLDVAAVEASEDALRASYTPLQSNWEREEAARSRDETLLEEEWHREKLPQETATTALAWAQNRLRENIDTLRENAERLDAIRQLLLSLATDTEQTIILGKEWRAAQATYWKTQADVGALPTTTNPAELVAVLRETLRYLQQANNPTACPVCAADTDAGLLRAQLTERLQALQSAAALVDANLAATQAQQLAHDRLQQAGNGLTAQLDLLATLLDAKTPAALLPCAATWDTYQTATPTPSEPHAKTLTGCALARKLNSCLAALETEVQQLTVRVALFDSLKNRVANFEEITRKLSETDAIRTRLKQAIDIVVERRKQFTQRLLDSITAEVNRLYSAIHPSENIGLDRLEMDPNRRASLTQRVNFAGHTSDVPPQAYFSESHLDTLGFCLWLALAKRSGAKEAIIVLDDVFTSVDLEHFQRITDLLDAEASQFKQLIIATHSRRWYDRYQRRRDNVHLLRLERWSLNQGVRVFSEKTFVAELETALAQVPLNRRDVATQAGVLLEELLHTVAAIYECGLPLREVPKFVLGELLGGTTSVLKVASIKRLRPVTAGMPPLNPTDAAAWETVAIRPIFEAVSRQSTDPRNAGAHYSQPGLELPDEEMEAFATATLVLAKALTCPVCFEVPRKIKDGSYRGCACPSPRKTQLLPVLRP
jgi:ABC-type Mn2+/Zn2+ transport system ATPase subunit